MTRRTAAPGKDTAPARARSSSTSKGRVGRKGRATAARKPAPFYRMSQWEADVLFWITPVVCTLSGLVRFEAGLWFETLLYLTLVIVPGTFVAGAAFDYVGHLVAHPKPGARLQKHKTQPPQYVRESLETALCMYIAAVLTAWPVTQYREGTQTAFYPTLEEASIGSGWVMHAFYMLKILGCLLFADFWTYWKHYSLHHPALYAIHRSHHRHHNPSSYASFAVHPVEAVLTFLPVVIMCDSSGLVKLYFPYHIVFMVGLWALNLYLHAGVDIPALEAVLRPLGINSSVHHNKHHELQVTHFAEVLVLWDYLLGFTTNEWDASRYESVSEAIESGGGVQASLDDF